MPLHLEELDVVSEAAGSGVKSALIVPCLMCPAVSAAVDAGEPFLRLFRHFLTSAPFERRIAELRSRLAARGIGSEVFRSPLPHQWFLCMCPAGRRAKLRKRLARHDAAIVLGCATAAETVREAAGPTDCRVLEGMTVTGFMNAKLRYRLPGTITFEDSRLVPLTRNGGALPR